MFISISVRLDEAPANPRVGSTDAHMHWGMPTLQLAGAKALAHSPSLTGTPQSRVLNATY